MIKKAITNTTNKSHRKKNKNNRSTVAYTDSSKIGILLQAGEFSDFTSLDELIKILTDDGKSVETLCLTPKGVEKLPISFSYTTFHKKDMGLTGNFKNHKVTSFISNDFDFLLSLNKKMTLPIRSIVSRSKSKCKIGNFSKNCKDYFDMMIFQKSNEEIHDLVKQMNIFVRKIKG